MQLIKREPGALGLRCWSITGKLRLRHFNEMDHELKARLSRAYRPAVKYMDTFSSPILAVLARQIIFFFGAPIAILVLFTLLDWDVLHVEYIVTTIALCTVLVTAARTFIPDENVVHFPELLMNNVIAHINYAPPEWAGKTHTKNVRNEFEQYFQLKAVSTNFTFNFTYGKIG